MEKGFLFNLKTLFVDPHKIVSEYISGRRKNIYNPISYLIITVTLYLIGDSFFPVSGKVQGKKLKFIRLDIKLGNLFETTSNIFGYYPLYG